MRGNQNVHLIDETTVVVKIGRKEGGGRSGCTVTRTAALGLTRMSGNHGKIVHQLAAICAQPDKAQRVNVTFAISDTHVGITFDPADPPDHPQRPRPVLAKKGRCLGIDLNPNWIGIAAAENIQDPRSVEKTSLLEHVLVKLDMAVDASAETVRETLRSSETAPSPWRASIAAARSCWKRAWAS